MSKVKTSQTEFGLLSYYSRSLYREACYIHGTALPGQAVNSNSAVCE